MEIIGIVVATHAEAQSLAPICDLIPQHVVKLDSRRWLYISGMGLHRAEEAAHALVSAGARALISWGTACGVSEELLPGVLVVPERVYANQNEFYPVTPSWREALVDQLKEGPSVIGGDLAHTEQILKDFHEKSKLKKMLPVVAADQESLGIAKVAYQRKLPFLIIRTVVDAVEDSLPEAAMRALQPNGQMDWGSFLFQILRNPSEFIALLRLRKKFQKAIHVLRLVARHI